jgi:hypothetical protein
MPPIKLNARVLHSLVFTVLSSINNWVRVVPRLVMPCAAPTAADLVSFLAVAAKNAIVAIERQVVSNWFVGNDTTTPSDAAWQ